MDARPLDGRREPCQRPRIERQLVRKGQRTLDVGRRDKREGDSWRVAFFPAQARPEARVDNGLDRGAVGLGRDRARAVRACRLPMAREVRLDARRHEARRRIRRFSPGGHHSIVLLS
jgi:hypothetical protein